MRGKERPSKHLRPLVVTRPTCPDGEVEPVVLTTYSATKRRPWAVRAANRIKNRRARAARKANR